MTTESFRILSRRVINRISSICPTRKSCVCTAIAIECCFKVCKSLLKLGKEFHGVSYDLTVSSTAMVFTRYILLEWIRRQENDGRTLGELVYCVFDQQPLCLS